ncbi:MAG: chorismate synthase [Bacteroidetes bacterium]|jgi:chorismate synthase|nr:chorismate synthase [Bacteroidota bacterium]MBT4398512.1 chorismate synthase [Bacteroidota bacterium]MBT4411658.1 chorismate synthase [Bacteroidota bacterium]MBT5426754.1 chorismate synthase [Bacteroidota bacterium]MBT7095318.1 chorismate synthase [Bacteroidota bacterium]
MNNYGTLFRISIFGESHGFGVGITIDGCPPGIALEENDFLPDLARRQAGAKGTTPRVEKDLPELISGWYKGYTTGAPLTVLFRNENTKSKDYDHLLIQPRPGHADWVAGKKYAGYQDHRGGGHFSGRLTLGLVAAGVVAKKLINPISVSARLIEAGGNSNIEAAVEEAIAGHDSIGGMVECIASPMPVGLGEPFFDSLESKIAHLVFAIPATKGIEFGSGFSAAHMNGSEHNDEILTTGGKTKTNHAGGINGGISNGNDLVFRVAIKPTSSIGKSQQSINLASGKTEELTIGGRHDTCIALRVPVVVEAVTALALADLSLQNNALKGVKPHG